MAGALQARRYPASRTKLALRLLDPRCGRADAAPLLERLARDGGLACLLRSKPHHRIGPLLAERIRRLGVDTDVPELRPAAKLLQHISGACRLRNQLLRSQLGRAVDLLAARGIRTCLIKGAVSLADEPPAGCLSHAVRMMEDIDLVVAPQDGDAALALMREQGWLCTSGTEVVPFDVDSPAFIDMHVWSPRNPATGLLDLADFFDRAAPATVGGREVTAPGPHQIVQLRLVHNVIRQHLFIDFPLMDLCELSAIISAHHDEIDWAAIRKVGLERGVSRVFYAVLMRLRDELGAPVPEGAIPPMERKAARRTLRTIEGLAAVPEGLYCAASRYALISSTPGRFVDRVNRACIELFEGPCAGLSSVQLPKALALSARMLALQSAVYCRTLVRG